MAKVKENIYPIVIAALLGCIISIVGYCGQRIINHMDNTSVKIEQMLTEVSNIKLVIQSMPPEKWREKIINNEIEIEKLKAKTNGRQASRL